MAEETLVATPPVRVFAVVAACYISTLLFLKLQFTEAGPAILFPSYAILTAALLFSKPRHWWMYLLASSAANFIPHAMVFPTPYVLVTEIANYVKAGIAAYGVQRFSAGRPGLDRLRSMLAFLGFAVVLGPCCAAFIGAGSAVAFNGAQGYWPVWRGWFLSNATTALVLLPLIITFITRAPARPVVWRVARILEATALAASLFLLAVIVFVWADTGVSDIPARFYMPLPLLVWAALRFGLRGTSASVLLLTSVTIWGAVAGRGPFIDRTPTENLLELQVFIIAVSFSFMVLSAVVEERRHKEDALRESESELKKSYEQVQGLHDTQQQLTGMLLHAQDDERRRIARDLHDVTVQNLAVIKAKISSGAGNRDGQPKESLGEAALLCDQVITELRTLSYLLHPPLLDETGLVEALHWYVRGFKQRAGVAVEILVLQDIGRLSREVETALFRVVQESLTNIHRHSGSRTAIIWITVESDDVVVRIKDEGAGMKVKSRPDEHGKVQLGVGILGMRERLKQLGGRLEITSDARGTTVTAVTPIHRKGYAAHSRG